MDYPLLLTLFDAIAAQKDPYNHHGVNVAITTIKVAKAMKRFDKDELEMISYGAGLHDIGKIFLPDGLLNHNRKLTKNEFENVKTHVIRGYDFAKQLKLDPIVLWCIYEHHERLDGSGYPRKLKGKEITIYGRLLAVMDVYESIIHDRAYRKADTPANAMMFLEGEADRTFDEDIVRTLRKVLEKEGVL